MTTRRSFHRRYKRGSSVIHDSPTRALSELDAQSRLAPPFVGNRAPSPAYVESQSAPSPSPSHASASQCQTSNAPSAAPPPHLPVTCEEVGFKSQAQTHVAPSSNTPKQPPEASSPGPTFIATQPQQVRPTCAQGTVRPTSIGVIKTALFSTPQSGCAVPALVGGWAWARRGPTIYGHTEGDFASAVGPVLIVWSVEPPPLSPYQSQLLQRRQQSLSNGLGQRVTQGMRKPTTAPSQGPLRLLRNQAHLELLLFLGKEVRESQGQGWCCVSYRSEGCWRHRSRT